MLNSEGKAARQRAKILGFGAMLLVLTSMGYAQDTTGVLVLPDGGQEHILRERPARNIRVPGEWSTCKVYAVPDDTNYVSKGQAVKASGACPPQFFVQGYLIGKNQILVRDKICTLNAVGNCVEQRVASKEEMEEIHKKSGIEEVSSSLPPLPAIEEYNR